MIIGIFGKKHSGKSTLAQHLEQKHKFIRLNFKDGLIEDMKKKFPDLLEALRSHYSLQYVQDLFDEKPLLMRLLMQNYGTDVVRAEDEDRWVREWVASYESGKKGNYVVDDVRFHNELSALTERDAIFIRTVREGQEHDDKHSSEQLQEKFIEDFTINAPEGGDDVIKNQAEIIIKEIKSNND